MFKKIMLVSVILGLFSTGLMAKESDFVEAKKPKLALSKADLSVLDKALDKGVSRLSKKEKKLIEKFLKDYKDSVKKEKVDNKKGKIGKVEDKKGKEDKIVSPLPKKTKAKGKSSKK